jgi:DHH family
MNPILIEYCKRFEQTSRPDNYVKPVFDEFFTNLNVSTHWEKLPYLHNIQNFCLRLLLAQIRGDKLCVYSDYDTDAVTATAVMYHGLLDLGFDPNNVEFYAPDRFTEGYGMNTEAIDKLSQKFDLIISVDCGINSWPEAEIVNQNNLKNYPLDKEGQTKSGEIPHRCDLMITDHHHLTDKIPDCVAVINCRMGEVYSQRSTELKEINQDLIDQIKKNLKLKPKVSKNSPLLYNTNLNHDISFQIKIQTWLASTQIQTNQYTTNPNKFLSQSVTGVGVAWFSLIWYAYFLEYIEF